MLARLSVRSLPAVLAFAAVLALALADPATAQEPRRKPGGDDKPGEGMWVTYDSSQDDIEIKGNKLVHLIHHMESDPNRPQNPNPISVKTERREGELSAAQLSELASLIDSAGFFKLNDQYGGAEGQRYYAYVIHVKQEKPVREKKVTYRSRPDAEVRPPAFARVEERLLAVAKEVAKAKTPEPGSDKPENNKPESK